jgi:hypothetical protein
MIETLFVLSLGALAVGAGIWLIRGLRDPSNGGTYHTPGNAVFNGFVCGPALVCAGCGGSVYILAGDGVVLVIVTLVSLLAAVASALYVYGRGHNQRLAALQEEPVDQ